MENRTLGTYVSNK